LDIAGTLVETKSEMKVLGVTFDCNLSWEQHIRRTLQKCNSKLGVLRKIRKLLTVDQFLKIVTAQYYSVLYYGSVVWLSGTTKASLKSLINTAHFKPLRLAMNDFHKRIKREELSLLCKRANPIDWVRYSLASLVIKTYKHREPFYLYLCLNETLYTVRRKPLIGRFFDNSKGKVGKQKICNKLRFMDSLNTDWIGKDISNDALRRMLKKTFFPYFNETGNTTRS